MKTSAFIIFVTIVTVIYGLSNYYIFWRGLQTFPHGSNGRTWYIIIFWLLAACFILSRFLERVIPSLFVDIMIWIGSFWLAVMLYAFIYTVAVDLGRLVLWAGRISLFEHTDPARLRMYVFGTGVILIFFVILSGFINARISRLTVLNLEINKVIEGKKELKIAVATDIHLGTLIGANGTARLVKQLNSIKADIILLAGDVVDEDLMPVIRQNLGNKLKDLTAPLGVYAITGNHEYIGGAEAAVKYLEEHGVRFIRDTAILVDDRFWLAGREDRDRPRFTGKKRKEIEQVLEGVDKSKPLILMDHQPFELHRAAANGADLQISGHTHYGQIWPLNHITNIVYEKSWGYLKKGDSHFYISSGFGSWGPPIRIGNYPEVIEINLHFR